MLAKRVIPCLDVKDGRVVKGVRFVDLRDAGDPVEAALAYDAQGADELVFLDITASHEAREIMLDVARRTAEGIYMPLTVGGGIRPIDDMRRLRRGLGARDRLWRRRLARAPLRGARRGTRRRGAGGVHLPLRPPHHRGGQGLSRGARRRGAVRAMRVEELTFDAQGLIPTVVQEADTGELLMVAWMDRPAVEKTLASGVTHFWSRSRGVPWRKGETSGHTQHVQAVYADCDADALLVQVHQEGVACHTGQRTCFFTTLQAGGGPPGSQPPANMLERLERTIETRKTNPPSGSYVAGLLAAGEAAICRKIGEEATEVITAALGGEGDRRLIEEAADLWFHTLVLLGARAIPFREVVEELARRHAERTTPDR